MTSTSLIKIGSQPKHNNNSTSKFKQFFSGTVADKFFLLGSIAIIIGALWFGVHLWLLRTGQITPKPLHEIYRELHGIIQVYLFFGVFACGFLLQAGPKLLASSYSNQGIAWSILALNIIGAVLLGINPSGIWGRGALCIAYVLLAVNIFLTTLHGANRYRIGIALPILFGSVLLAALIFLELRSPLNSLLLFWGGVLPIVLGAAQQFIGGILGGSKLSNREGLIVWGLWIAATGCLYGFITYSQHWLWNSFLAFGLISFFLYCIKVRLFISILSDRSAALNQTLLSGTFWLVSGVLVLLLGPAWSDSALHLWGTGLIVPLIIAVSMRIVGFLSSTEVMSERLYLWLLSIWQLVPIGRGLAPFLGLPGWFSWIVGFAATGLIGVWFYLLIKGIWRITKYQLGLPPEKKPISC